MIVAKLCTLKVPLNKVCQLVYAIIFAELKHCNITTGIKLFGSYLLVTNLAQ